MKSRSHLVLVTTSNSPFDEIIIDHVMDFFFVAHIGFFVYDDPPVAWGNKENIKTRKHDQNQNQSRKKIAIIVPVVIFCPFSSHIHENADNTFAYVYRADH